MGEVVSVFTEAHFAACLLECGPHEWSECPVSNCNSPAHADANIKYRERVYKHFLNSHPEIVNHAHAQDHLITLQWGAFWREYIKWVQP